MKQGWEECNLEDYIKLIDYRGRTPVKTESGVRLITAKNVKLGYLQLEPQEFIAANNYDSWMSRGIPNVGDVIFTTEAPLANVAQIDTSEKLAFAQRIIVMQPKANKIDATFLKHMLLSETVRKKILEKGTGATVLGIKSSLLKKIRISFPPLPEQQRIVAILDEAFAAIANAKANAEQNLKNARELFESYLQGVFENKGEGWEIKTLDEVCTIKGRIGYRGYTKQDLVEEGEGAISLSPSNIKDNQIIYKNCTYISWFKYDESPEIKIFDGDIIYCKTASIGKIALIENLPEKATINPQFVVLKELKCSSKYLFFFMNSREFKEQERQIIGGTAIPTLSQANLGNLKIPIPSLPEQKAIVQKLDALSAETKKLEEIYNQKLNDLEELKKSVLQKAFSGKLK